MSEIGLRELRHKASELVRRAEAGEAEHVTKPAVEVLVQKRKMRVLLFAGGPTREYQFLRTLLFREVLEIDVLWHPRQSKQPAKARCNRDRALVRVVDEAPKTKVVAKNRKLAVP